MENLPIPDILICRATRANADIVTEFNLLGAKESANRDLDREQVRAGVLQVLKGHPDFYLLAQANGDYIGQLKVHHQWYDWYDSLFWWIEHVYVDPKFRRTGVSQKLLEHVWQLARANGDVKELLLHVSSTNTKAITSYQKFGFDNVPLFPMRLEVKTA